MSRVKAEFIDPREHGQRALDLSVPVFNDEAVASAQRAIETFRDEFPAWLRADVDRLQALRSEAALGGWDEVRQEALRTAAHDLKGLGSTYGFPIVTEIAASLCRLIETEGGRDLTKRNPHLACAHVDALRAVVRAEVTSDDHPVGRALLAELRQQVANSIR
jgi:hypothetical protein